MITDEKVINEIRIKYKNWVDISVLSQLYCQPSDEIRKIVAGVERLKLTPKESVKAVRRGNRNKDEMDFLYERMAELHSMGYHNSAIGITLDCSSSVVDRFLEKTGRIPNIYNRSKEI